MELKPATVVQLGFIAIAAVAVFGFVRAAQNDHRRTSCNALCALSPAYAGRDRLAPDFELSDMNGAAAGETFPCLSKPYRGSELAEALRSLHTT